MKTLILFVFFGLLHSLGFAQDSPLNGALDNSQVEIVESKQSSDDLLLDHIFNHKISNSLSRILGHGQHISQEHITEKSQTLIRQFTKANSTKKHAQHERIIIAAYYQISDPQIQQALIHARKKGIKVLILTDLNTIFNSLSQAKKISVTSNQELESLLKRKKIEYKHSQTAEIFKGFLKAGFKIGNNLVGFPVITNKPYDIFHLKQLLFLGVNSDAEFLPRDGLLSKLLFWRRKVNAEKSSTSSLVQQLIKNQEYLYPYLEVNTTKNPTGDHTDTAAVNRALILRGSDITIFSAQQLALKAGELAKGKEVKDVQGKIKPAYQVNFSDGSMYRRTYTQQGGLDVLKQAQAVLQATYLLPERYELKSVKVAHFAFTNKDLLIDLKNALEIHKKAKGLIYTGASFMDRASHVMSGSFMIDGNFVIEPLSKEAQRRLKTYLHQRANEESRAEYTGNFNMHDKIIIIDIKETSGSWSYIFFGSQNASTRFTNTEVFDVIRVKANSKLAKGVKSSLNGLARNNKDVFVDLETGMMRNAYRKLISEKSKSSDSINIDQIPLKNIKKIMKARQSGNYDAFHSAIEDLYITVKGEGPSDEFKKELLFLQRMTNWIHYQQLDTKPSLWGKLKTAIDRKILRSQDLKQTSVYSMIHLTHDFATAARKDKAMMAKPLFLILYSEGLIDQNTPLDEITDTIRKAINYIHNNKSNVVAKGKIKAEVEKLRFRNGQSKDIYKPAPLCEKALK